MPLASSQDSVFSHCRLFTRLPIELLVQILSALDCRTLLRCKEICRSFDALIASTASLQLIIELHAAGQGMESNSTHNSSGRLELLKKRNAAWDKLEFTKDQRIPMLQGGLWELYGGVLAQSTEENTITFRRLPSMCRSIEETDWTLDGFGFPVRDFGMDPSQDLLVLVEAPRWSDTTHPCRIHLRSLSTGSQHPMAHHPTILCDVQKVSDHFLSYTIQVSADHLGILFSYSSGPENEFYIWEWRTGNIETVLFGEEIESFVFLTDHEVILALSNVSEAGVAPALLALNFKEESKEKHNITEVEHGISFLYPSLHPEIGLVRFEVRSDPAPKLTPLSRLQLPFYVAHHNRLFTVSLVVFVDGQLQTIMLFAPLSTFQSCLARRLLGQKIINWSVWGPPGTRILMPLKAPDDVWVCYVNSSKYVVLRRTRKHGIAVDVYDFYQPALSRALGNPDHGTRCVTSTNFFAAGHVFGQEIQTSLPYQFRTLPLDSRYNSDMAVMCAEDHLIIVDAHVDRKEFRILSF